MIDLSNVKVGDPDPTGGPTLDPFLCPWTYDAGRDEFYCTRMPDHPGPHIAGDGDEVLAVWS